MSAAILVDVDVPIVSPNRLMGEHFRTRHWRRRRERAAVRRAVNGKRPPPGPWLVTFTRCGPLKLDDDNLSMSFKSCRDEVALWLGVDDRDARVTWVYEQAKERVPVSRWERVGLKKPAFKVWARVRIEHASQCAEIRGSGNVSCDDVVGSFLFDNY